VTAMEEGANAGENGGEHLMGQDGNGEQSPPVQQHEHGVHANEDGGAAGILPAVHSNGNAAEDVAMAVNGNEGIRKRKLSISDEMDGSHDMARPSKIQSRDRPMDTSELVSLTPSATEILRRDSIESRTSLSDLERTRSVESARSPSGGDKFELPRPLTNSPRTSFIAPGHQLGRTGSSSNNSIFTRTTSGGTKLISMSFSRTASAAIESLLTPERTSSDPKSRLAGLLGKIKFDFTSTQEKILIEAFKCEDCCDETTTCHQIRAVYDAFHLSWDGAHPCKSYHETGRDDDGPKGNLLSVSDLTATVRKCEFGDEFLFLLVENLKVLPNLNPNALTFGAKEFMVAFAQTLKSAAPDRRMHYHRAVGRMFGIEKTHQRFRFKKFLYAFLADNLAVITHPICIIQSLLPKSKTRLFQIMSDACWLPLPYNQYRDFQWYLMKLWLPSCMSLGLYLYYSEYMTNISIVESMGPIVLYQLVGLIVATISAFEHRGLVMRRKYVLTGESKQEDLRAMFAFRAHTPEGHVVERIGLIADLCTPASQFKYLARILSCAMGLLHFLVPILRRVYNYYMTSSSSRQRSQEGQCFSGGWEWTEVLGPTCTDAERRSVAWNLLFGGDHYLHAFVTLPAAAVAGYLVYRLLFITFDIFYNDLAFYYKLKLFRASTTPGYYLTYRRKWLRTVRSDKALQERVGRWDGRGFMPFLSLQEEKDLILWCRIRQLLIDSCGGFKSAQRDVVFTYMMFVLLVLSVILVLNHYDWWLAGGRGGNAARPINVLDLWALLDCIVFSCVLCAIMYLKLAVYDMCRSDIHLLHAEYYRASLNARSQVYLESDPPPADPDQDMSRFRFSLSASGIVHQPLDSSLDIAASGSMEESEQNGQCEVQEEPGDGRELRRASTSSFNFRGQNNCFSRAPSSRSSMKGSVTGGALGESVMITPKSERARQELQVLIEQTARYIQQFDRPPTVLGYPVTWDVLRYMSLSLIAAILTGLKGTIFRSLFTAPTQPSA